jgi:hypothetical protein
MTFGVDGLSKTSNKQSEIHMQTKNDHIINVENLQKTFYSIRGFWKREKHPVEAVGISFQAARQCSWLVERRRQNDHG